MPAFGIRALLLAAAVVFFVIAWLGDDVDFTNWLSLGLGCFAAAFLVDALGLDRRLGGGPTTRP
jgi:hypothetical protein